MEQKIKRLTCCVCGSETRGRQWWNRDTGYGLCESCADSPRIIAEIKLAEFDGAAPYYGVRGVHYCVGKEVSP